MNEFFLFFLFLLNFFLVELHPLLGKSNFCMELLVDSTRSIRFW